MQVLIKTLRNRQKHRWANLPDAAQAVRCAVHDQALRMRPSSRHAQEVALEVALDFAWPEVKAVDEDWPRQKTQGLASSCEAQERLPGSCVPGGSNRISSLICTSRAFFFFFEKGGGLDRLSALLSSASPPPRTCRLDSLAVRDSLKDVRDSFLKPVNSNPGPT